MEIEYGKKLREARNKRNFSLDDVSSELKINLKTLKSIENSDTAFLPKPPFTKGFIKTYCRYLGIEPGVIVGEYEKTLDEPTQNLQKGVLKEEVEGANFLAFDFLKNKFFPMVILLSTLIGIAATYSMLNKKPLNLAKFNPIVETQSNKMILKTPAVKTTATVEVEKVTNFEKLKHVAVAPDKREAKEFNKEVESKTVAKEKVVPRALASFNNILVVEPLAKTTLYIKKNSDEKFVKITLKPDQIRTFKFNGAEIRFLDAGAVNLTMNGEDIDALGGFGEEKRIEFPSMKEL